MLAGMAPRRTICFESTRRFRSTTCSNGYVRSKALFWGCLPPAFLLFLSEELGLTLRTGLTTLDLACFSTTVIASSRYAYCFLKSFASILLSPCSR